MVSMIILVPIVNLWTERKSIILMQNKPYKTTKRRGLPKGRPLSENNYGVSGEKYNTLWALRVVIAFVDNLFHIAPTSIEVISNSWGKSSVAVSLSCPKANNVKNNIGDSSLYNDCYVINHLNIDCIPSGWHFCDKFGH